MTPRRKPTVPADRLGEPHAQLRDDEGKLLGGIVLKDGQWVLGLGGRIVGESASAAHVLAILKRAAAHKEAEAEGLDFDAFQARLVAQMDAAGKTES